MTQRNTLPAEKVSPVAAKAMAAYHKDVVQEVERAIAQHAVVVVGMGINPLVGKVCRALTEAGIAFHFISYGSYFSQWRKRLAIKLWSGWPTFPQVFVKGVLVGGCVDTKRLIAEGKIS